MWNSDQSTLEGAPPALRLPRLIHVVIRELFDKIQQAHFEMPRIAKLH